MGHFYDRSGKPMYYIDGRDTTLRDARKLGLVGSVTEILGVVDKPALTNWKCEQAIRAAYRNPPLANESEDDYVARIMPISKQKVVDAADEGSKIHDAIECSFKGEAYPERYEKHVASTHAELGKIFPDVNDWVSEHSFAHPSGYGGKSDIHSPSTGIVPDIKTKDGDFTETDKYGRPKKLGYDQHWQLAAYQDGLCLPRAPGAAIFVSRTHPGAVASHVWSAEEMEKGAQIFHAALALHKLLKGYDGSWE